MEEVAKSIADQGSVSKYFPVLEQYMYREHQYSQVNVVYKKRKEVEKGKEVMQITKYTGEPLENLGKVQWKSGQIIAENPYYEGPTSGKHQYKQINGITYPVNEPYIALQISDNSLTDMNERYGISKITYDLGRKDALTQTKFNAWKRGE